MTSTMAKQNEVQPHTPHPVVFEEFFDLGLDESKSPFLTPSSRNWGKNLSLKASIFAAILLFISFLLSFHLSLLPLSYLALTFVFFIVGVPSLIDAIEHVMNLEINIDVLMTLAAFSSIPIGGGIEGALLLVLFSISHAMEHAVTDKAKSSISSLTKLSPTTASVIQPDGSLIERAVRDVAVGTKILIKSGQVIPLDGTILEGTSSVNLMHLTGENLPVTKKPGDTVPSGGRNLEGVLTVEVTHSSADSTLSRIIKLVTQAQEARPKLQQWFNRLSSTYATTIILLSFLFAVGLPFLIGIPYFSVEGSIYRALAFLIAASPCALIIAMPIAYLSAISVCAKNGILLKGGITLDALSKCKVFAFDKTGTLTTGKLKCKAVESLNSTDPSELFEALSVAYALERGTVHPVAQAIVDYCQELSVSLGTIKTVKSIPGYGIEAVASTASGDVSCAIGHVEFIAQKLPPECAEQLSKYTDQIKKEGDLVSVLLFGEAVYIFHFEDSPRPKAKKTLGDLRKSSGMRLLMLTGDHYESAQKIAKEMGIDEYYANLRPEDKLAYVSQIAQEKGLAMVGDGVNDAPALARATVGICMGKIGSTAALDAADIVLLQDNIELLDWLTKKAHQTQKIVRQNLTIAIAAIFIASLPALAGWVPLWLAVVLHEGGTVLVGLNALRLLKK